MAAQVERDKGMRPVQGHSQRHLLPLPEQVQLRMLPSVLLGYQVVEVDALPRPAAVVQTRHNPSVTADADQPHHV